MERRSRIAGRSKLESHYVCFCKKNIDNYIATIDFNGQQIDGPTYKVINMGSLQAKFEAFDWDVMEIKEGNNVEAIIKELASAKSKTGKGLALCLLMSMRKGSFLII